MAERKRTVELFLWSMSIMYLFAFASLFVQIPGLYGDNGILPVKLVLQKAPDSLHDLLASQPSLLRVLPWFGIDDVQTGMDSLCLLGITLSFLAVISQMFRNAVTYFILWALYLSLFTVGQTFLWFQWDTLLLEVGFLTVILAPLGPHGIRSRWFHQHDGITFFLIKWLTFRLMFCSGVVKLLSNCPTWWGLTALNYHYESQCIPTPGAWYFHQLPNWFQKLSTVVTYVIEIPLSFLFFSAVRNQRILAFSGQCIPMPMAWYFHHLPDWCQRLSVACVFIIQIPAAFLFFSPLRNHRIVSFLGQVLLMVLIILTGNYNFFNWITIVLCLSLVDDDFLPVTRWTKKMSREEEKLKRLTQASKLCCLTKCLINLFVYGTLLLGTIYYFSVRLSLRHFSFDCSIAFTIDDFREFLHKAVPVSIWIGIICLCVEIISSLLRSLFAESGFLRKTTNTLGCIFFGLVAVWMFCLSLVPYTDIERGTQQRLPASFNSWFQSTSSVQLTHSYGLFRSMTGVGGRPEVIVEGSDYPDKGWKEYNFLFKPGDVGRKPPVVAPHQPRLDWQMWFAALGSYNYNPWFLNLIYRLLMNQREVVQLIDKGPFDSSPPNYIRAHLYHYHFTSFNSSSKDWWKREFVREYLPVVWKTEPSFVNYLKGAGLYKKPDEPESVEDDSGLKHLMEALHTLFQPSDGFFFCVALLATAVMFMIIKDAVCGHS